LSRFRRALSAWRLWAGQPLRLRAGLAWHGVLPAAGGTNVTNNLTASSEAHMQGLFQGAIAATNTQADMLSGGSIGTGGARLIPAWLSWTFERTRMEAPRHWTPPLFEDAAAGQEVLPDGSWASQFLAPRDWLDAINEFITQAPPLPPKVVDVLQAVETDLAQAVTWAPKNRLVGQAAEADLAQAVDRRKAVAVAQALESSLAQGVTSRKTALLGQAAETDLAQSVTKAGLTVAVGQVIETDTAQAVGASKRLGLAQVAEVDTAQAVLWQIRRLIGQAAELDSAMAVTPSTPGGGGFFRWFRGSKRRR